MNTFDFDCTIFYPDSSYSFVMYCLRHYPRAVLRCVPANAKLIWKCLNGEGSTQALKECIFSFLRYIDDVDAVVKSFWDENHQRIGQWYYDVAKKDDVIISASPEFLLKPVAEKLGVRLIATPMDKYSGVIMGKNCHDEEKVRRFTKEFPGAHTECFYSDSLSDTPMAKLADKAYIVKKGVLSPWPKDEKAAGSK